MRAAAIDIGTNTTLALLAEEAGGKLHTIRDTMTPNGLGDALRNGYSLPRETIILNVDLLHEISRDFRRDGSEQCAVCGTSALRRAENRAEFSAAVSEVLGLDVEIISGSEEARLTFAGAVSGREIYPGEKIRVIDLGGGSTEIIEGSSGAPGQSMSLDVGAVYLTSEFFTEDPPSPAIARSLRDCVRERLDGYSVPAGNGRINTILVGGTAVTLAILKTGLKQYDPVPVGGTFLTAADLDELTERLQGKSSRELQSLPGMPLGRGKFIFAGTLLLRELFTAMNIQEAVVSERGLRHGLWLDRFGNRNPSA